MTSSRHHATRAVHSSRQRTALVLGACAMWSLALIVAGVVMSGETWGLGMLAVGGSTALVCVVAAWTNRWQTALFGSLFVLTSGMTVIGGMHAGELWGLLVLAAGLVGVVVCGVGCGVVWTLLDAQIEPERRRHAAPAASTEPVERSVSGGSDMMVLSEPVRRALYRDQERSMVRDAIEQAFAEDELERIWDICDALGDEPEWMPEISAVRDRLESARTARREATLREALDMLARALISRDWGLVFSQAAEIRREYAGMVDVNDLNARIQSVRDEYKQQLEAGFRQAASSDDVDGAMSLLKELDRYMTRDEAEQLRETARTVVTRRRERLGDLFRQAVQTHRWHDAARIGTQIVEEFPNARMAEEVRSMLDTIRTRATQAAISEE